jgi:predicted Rossmann fold flavoprotein
MPTNESRYDAIVLGAGAAGLMCAIEAGKRGRRVVVLERAERHGKKILISGGGRCNFTNIHCGPENFLSANPHFAKSALARYTPAHFIALVERHGIAYHEKTLGQLFCDGSASAITELLATECRLAGVRIEVNCTVASIRRATEFAVATNRGTFHAPALVIATGGLSVPKIGATPFGYQVARQFGLKMQETRPGLVPFVLAPQDKADYCDLAGVSAEVVLSANHHSFREKMLITHCGLSGPAILQASSYWEPGSAISIDLAPGGEVMGTLRNAKKKNAAAARAQLRKVLPNRLADRWLDLHAPASWTNSAIDQMEHELHRWTLAPADTEGYAKAEVTVGGVDTAELSAKTMESSKVCGLFFVGEMVDVTGQLGGYNFQWAWASGAAAGRAIGA